MIWSLPNSPDITVDPLLYCTKHLPAPGPLCTTFPQLGTFLLLIPLLLTNTH